MSGFKNEHILKVIYMAHGASGSGAALNDALPIESGSLMEVEDGEVVTGVDMVILTAVAGATAVTVGDDTDPDGLVAAVDVTLATPGAYVGAGALLPKAYTVDDTIDAAVTGASSAGELAVVVKGYRV